MARRNIIVAASLVLAATAACSDEPLQTVNPGESSGEVCSPLDGDGVASFSWESVTNTSDKAVQVLDVEPGDLKAPGSKATAHVRIQEWFLTPMNWEPAGVGPGPLERPGDALLPNEVGPGEEVLVSIAVKADNLDAPHTMRPYITYQEDGKEQKTTLSFNVSIVPHGTECEE